jgi:hypothetical protein
MLLPEHAAKVRLKNTKMLSIETKIEVDFLMRGSPGERCEDTPHPSRRTAVPLHLLLKSFN